MHPAQGMSLGANTCTQHHPGNDIICWSGTKAGGLVALAMLVGAPVIEFGIIQELGWWHYPKADLFGSVGLPSWYGHGGVIPWYSIPFSPSKADCPGHPVCTALMSVLVVS